VNRVGDFGFLLAIALVLAYFGTLDYAAVFSRAPSMAGATIESSPGAVAAPFGESASAFHRRDGQVGAVPLHVWLPELDGGSHSDFGSDPPATMVTAGIFNGGADVAAVRALADRARARAFDRRITPFSWLIAVVQYEHQARGGVSTHSRSSDTCRGARCHRRIPRARSYATTRLMSYWTTAIKAMKRR